MIFNIHFTSVKVAKFLICMNIMFVRSFSSHTIRCTNVFRHTIIFDNKMPSIYLEKDLYVEDRLKNSVYSVEHIFPRSHLSFMHVNDMHNTIKTINTLNVNRSNYEYVDDVGLKLDKNWIKLDFGNYVNHKKKMFIPNHASRGFISRAILYMCREYDYNPAKIIKKDVLGKWFYDYPPTKEEKYHNEIIRKMQNKNNIFIANYNKKKAFVAKFIDTL